MSPEPGREPQYYPEDEKAAGLAGYREHGRAGAGPLAGGVCRWLPMSPIVRRWQDTVDATLKEFGRIDILINNSAFARGPDRGAADRPPRRRCGGKFSISSSPAVFFDESGPVVPPMIRQGQGRQYSECLVHCRQKGQSEYGGLLYLELRDSGLYPSPGPWNWPRIISGSTPCVRASLIPRVWTTSGGRKPGTKPFSS